ncbi:MAG: GAF domain-containing sensor histidine kinase [Anaerolineaceae bacterium]|nr:GAF domain-containing sensor histidine kinase [Anaerolineaceae bacterium]
MYQESERVATSQHKSIIAHATLDKQLNILSYAPELGQWSNRSSLSGLCLFDLFPQLEANRDRILACLQAPSGAFVYHQAHFADNIHADQLFNLQIEALPDLPNKLLLTVIPIAAPTALHDKNLGELTRHNRELLLLNRASQILTATLNSAAVMENLLQLAAQIIHAEGSSLWLWTDEQQKTLICRAAFHPGTDEKLMGLEVASGQGVVGWVAATSKATIVADPAADARFYPHIDSSSGFVTTSLLAVPVQLRNRTLGVLEVVNKRDGRFSAQDISYAKTLAASAAIAIENAKLVETLRQTNADLQIQNEELEAFDRTVAHDLQNPLALVVGFADLLQTSAVDISHTERDRALQLLVQNAHRMSSIIQEMLILSSVRKHDVETHPLDMAEVVLGAMDRLRFMMEQYKVRIILPDSWEVARGYAPWIEEVWENYISNALKYGGSPPVIEMGSQLLADGRIRFWIRDNGQGIAPEKQPLLFTPFTKVSQVRVTGHGLGLSIIRRIMEKLGGEVGLESEPGQGSTFSFILPAYRVEDEKTAVKVAEPF